MTDLRNEPTPTVSERVSGGAADGTPPAEHRRWPWLVAALVTAALLTVSGVWWLLDSTVAANDYNDVVAELDATKQALTSTQEALDELRSRFQRAEPSALLLGYSAGVDREIVDQNRYESWSGVVQLDAAVQAVNDPELTDLYWQHMGKAAREWVEAEFSMTAMVQRVEAVYEQALSRALATTSPTL